MKPSDNLEDMIRKDLNYTAGADLHDRMLNDVLNAQENTKRTQPATTKPSIRRQIMRSPMTKYAAAAMIIIAVVVGVHQFGSLTSSVAWGEVVHNVEKIHTIQYRETITGPEEKTTMMYVSCEYGLKEVCYKNGEISTITCYQKPERMLVAVLPLAKAYERRLLTERELEGIDNRVSVRWIINKFMSVKHKELGQSNVNGVEVEGIEINSTEAFNEFLPSVDSFVGRLWVDVVSDLPVLIELEFVPAGTNLQTKLVVDEIKWNTELSSSDFEPNIPEDYTLLER